MDDLPSVPEPEYFPAPKIDLDIGFNQYGKPELKTDFVVEGPAELFTGSDFDAGVGRPILDTFIEPIERPDTRQFDYEINQLDSFRENKPTLLEVYDVPPPPTIDDYPSEDFRGIIE